MKLLHFTHFDRRTHQLTEYIYFLPSHALFLSYTKPVPSHYRRYPSICQLLRDCMIAASEVRFMLNTLQPLDIKRRAAVADVYGAALDCWLELDDPVLPRPVKDFLRATQERIALYGVDNVLDELTWDGPPMAVHTYSLETLARYLAFVNHVVPPNFLVVFLEDDGTEDCMPTTIIMDCTG